MPTIRTQVYLEVDHYQRLLQRRERLGISMAGQIREAVRQYLEEVGEDYLDDPIWRITGAMNSGVGDLSVQHDRYLY